MTAGAGYIAYLRNQLADRMEAHPPEEWSTEFIVALTALFDLEGTNKAAVLELVKR